MRRHKLDKIDKKIIRDLQENGRMTNVDLAKNAGISAPPCLRRVKTLEDQGYIKSYHARVNNSALGYGVTIFATVKLQNHGEQNLMKFVEKINDWEMVRECYMLAGDNDFMLKVVAKDWENYQEFLTHDLTATDNVQSVHSALCIRTSKEKAGVPIDID